MAMLAWFPGKHKTKPVSEHHLFQWISVGPAGVENSAGAFSTSTSPRETTSASASVWLSFTQGTLGFFFLYFFLRKYQRNKSISS